MTLRQSDILVLALGNDIMGDDAAGLVAARELKEEFGGVIDIFEVASAGFGLIDILEGYKKVLIVDSIPAAQGSEGNILELSEEDFPKQVAWSPHYVGLPEIIAVAKKLDMEFPDEIKILVLEIADLGTIHEGLSPEITGRIPQFVERARTVLNSWISMVPADGPAEISAAGQAHRYLTQKQGTF
jgi:hydrogenase maturation protease